MMNIEMGEQQQRGEPTPCMLNADEGCYYFVETIVFSPPLPPKKSRGPESPAFQFDAADYGGTEGEW
jgi:hypothetical protein